MDMLRVRVEWDGSAQATGELMGKTGKTAHLAEAFTDRAETGGQGPVP